MFTRSRPTHEVEPLAGGIVDVDESPAREDASRKDLENLFGTGYVAQLDDEAVAVALSIATRPAAEDADEDEDEARSL